MIFLLSGCEQIIVENINQLSLLGILEWSSQPHGSQYIYRQSLQYLREEFMSICKVPSILCNLPKRFLVAAIKSDYLQVNTQVYKYVCKEKSFKSKLNFKFFSVILGSCLFVLFLVQPKELLVNTRLTI